MLRAGHPHVRGDYGTGTSVRNGTTGHPHVRGDYTQAPCVNPSRTGPSPRAWGLLAGVGAAGKDERAIPTCVGTTSRVSRATRRKRGHPHVRGDYT